MLRERILNHPISCRDRVTATEVIDGTTCRVVLEQDMFGRYREKSVEVLHPTPSPRGRYPEPLEAGPPARPDAAWCGSS